MNTNVNFFSSSNICILPVLPVCDDDVGRQGVGDLVTVGLKGQLTPLGKELLVDPDVEKRVT